MRNAIDTSKGNPINTQSTMYRNSSPNKRIASIQFPGLKVRLAETLQDHLNAFHLIHEQFVEAGYIKSSPNKLRMLPWYLSPYAHTFLAEENTKPVGTVTCVEDSEYLLPADETFPDQINKLRSGKRKIVEVSGLATLANGSNTQVVLELIRYITTFCRNILQAEDWIITVNPKHVRYYKKVMMFEELGRISECKTAGGAPAVLLHLDLKTMPAKYKMKYARRTGIKNFYKFLFSPGEELLRLLSMKSAHREKGKMSW